MTLEPDRRKHWLRSFGILVIAVLALASAGHFWLVFVLAELEQMTLSEIGEIVGTNANTVATRLRAARQAFEKALARFQAQELGRSGS